MESFFSFIFLSLKCFIIYSLIFLGGEGFYKTCLIEQINLNTFIYPYDQKPVWILPTGGCSLRCPYNQNGSWLNGIMLKVSWQLHIMGGLCNVMELSERGSVMNMTTPSNSISIRDESYCWFVNITIYLILFDFLNWKGDDSCLPISLKTLL